MAFNMDGLRRSIRAFYRARHLCLAATFRVREVKDTRAHIGKKGKKKNEEKAKEKERVRKRGRQLEKDTESERERKREREQHERY